MLFPSTIPHSNRRPFNIDTGDATASVTGTAIRGQTLTCTFNNNDPDGPAIVGPTFQWIRGANTVIGGATASTYVLVNADIGSTVKCRLTYTDTLGFVETIDSNSTSAVVGIDTGDATASAAFQAPGVAQQGRSVTCTFNNNDPDGAASGITFQWFRGSGAPIGGATSSSHVATASDVGNTLLCRVNYTDAQGIAESIFSSATGVVAGVTTGVFFLQDANGVGGFAMPNYNTARLEVWGAGCGGSHGVLASGPSRAVAAGNSSCTSPGIGLVAEGGKPPTGGSATVLETPGAAATASGGITSNVNGNVASAGQIVTFGTANSGAGAPAPTGEAGGASVSHPATNGHVNGNVGSIAGSGGSGGASGNNGTATAHGYSGGNSGAYSCSDYVLGAGNSPSIGASFTATVGAGSAGAVITFGNGGAGVNGRVRLTITS